MKCQWIEPLAPCYALALYWVTRGGIARKVCQHHREIALAHSWENRN